MQNRPTNLDNRLDELDMVQRKFTSDCAMTALILKEYRADFDALIKANANLVEDGLATLQNLKLTTDNLIQQYMLAHEYVVAPVDNSDEVHENAANHKLKHIQRSVLANENRAALNAMAYLTEIYPFLSAIKGLWKPSRNLKFVGQSPQIILENAYGAPFKHLMTLRMLSQAIIKDLNDLLKSLPPRSKEAYYAKANLEIIESIERKFFRSAEIFRTLNIIKLVKPSNDRISVMLERLRLIQKKLSSQNVDTLPSVSVATDTATLDNKWMEAAANTLWVEPTTKPSDFIEPDRLRDLEEIFHLINDAFGNEWLSSADSALASASASAAAPAASAAEPIVKVNSVINIMEEYTREVTSSVSAASPVSSVSLTNPASATSPLSTVSPTSTTPPAPVTNYIESIKSKIKSLQEVHDDIQKHLKLLKKQNIINADLSANPQDSSNRTTNHRLFSAPVGQDDQPLLVHVEVKKEIKKYIERLTANLDKIERDKNRIIKMDDRQFVEYISHELHTLHDTTSMLVNGNTSANLLVQMYIAALQKTTELYSAPNTSASTPSKSSK